MLFNTTSLGNRSLPCRVLLCVGEAVLPWRVVGAWGHTEPARVGGGQAGQEGHQEKADQPTPVMSHARPTACLAPARLTVPCWLPLWPCCCPRVCACAGRPALLAAGLGEGKRHTHPALPHSCPPKRQAPGMQRQAHLKGGRQRGSSSQPPTPTSPNPLLPDITTRKTLSVWVGGVE